MKSIFIYLIRLYQGVFYNSRIIAHCRFFPCCSEYTIGAVNKYGPAKGLAKGIWRIIRCNPFSKGGLDLP